MRRRPQVAAQATHLLGVREEGARGQAVVQARSQVLAHEVASGGRLHPGLPGPHVRAWQAVQRRAAHAQVEVGGSSGGNFVQHASPMGLRQLHPRLALNGASRHETGTGRGQLYSRLYSRHREGNEWPSWNHRRLNRWAGPPPQLASSCRAPATVLARCPAFPTGRARSARLLAQAQHGC